MAARKKEGGLFGLDPRGSGGWISTVLAGLETVAAPQKRILDQIGQWGAHFSRAALERWGAAPMAGERCCMRRCDGEAVLRCMACGAPVCLAHVHVSHRAEGICDSCVAEAVARQVASPSRISRDELKRALRTLGLKWGATAGEIQRAYRAMAAKHHPDRARTDSQRRKCTERLSRINAAYHLLMAHTDKVAA